MEGKSLLHYRILHKLGQGGMGEVFAAEDTRLGRRIALKILPVEVASRADRRARFEREAKAVAALNHPNIVTVHSIEEVDGVYFITMELVEGKTLRGIVPDTGMHGDALYNLAIPIADAIAAAHSKGITHRDLKPDNVMVTKDHRVKVLDFGLAKIFDAAEQDPNEAADGVDEQLTVTDSTGLNAGPLTEEGKVLGTAAYMSPEQAEGKATDPRSDIFSFGILLYAMATGRRPFQGDTNASIIASILRDTPPPVTDLNHTLPKELARIVRRCLEKDPNRRYQSAADIRIELEDLQREGLAATSAESASLVGSDPQQFNPDPSQAAPAGPQSVASGSLSSDLSRSLSHPGDETAWARTLRAGIPKLLLVYGLVSAVVLFVVHWVMLQFGLPDWVVPGAAVLLLIGFPVLAATAFVQSSRGPREALQTHSGETALSGPPRASSPLPSTVDPGTPVQGRIRGWLTWRRAVVGGVLAFVSWAVIIGGFLYARNSGIGPFASLVSAGLLEEDSRIIIADFENLTDEAALSETMKQAFAVDLSQSTVVRLVPQSQVTTILARMELPPETRLSAELAREVAVRDGISAVVEGQVSPAGGDVILSVSLVNPSDGTTLAAFRESAARSDGMIRAIDRLSKQLREKMGESFRDVRRSQPLERVTTSSLEALQKYSAAVAAGDGGEELLGIALLEEATALDTTFAMAYRKLGVLRRNTFQQKSLRVDAFTRAFRHRDRLPDRERCLTEAAYYEWVMNDRDQAILAYQELLRMDPMDTWALNNLSQIYSRLGRNKVALEMSRRNYEIEKSLMHTANLAGALLTNHKLDECESLLKEGKLLFPNDLKNSYMGIALEWNRGNHEEALDLMAERRRAETPDKQSGNRFTAHALLAAQGRLREARLLAEEEIDESERLGQLSRVLRMATMHLVARWGQLGDEGIDDEFLEDALGRAPVDSLPVLDRPLREIGHIYAVWKQPETARKFLDRHKQEAESVLGGTVGAAYHQSLGTVALSEGNPEKAMQHFRRSQREDLRNNSILFWLGLANVESSAPDSAIANWERYLERPGWAKPFSDQIYLASTYKGLGSLYEEKGEVGRAVDYYTRFLDLYKRADPEFQPEVSRVRQRVQRLLSEKGGTLIRGE